MLSADLGEFLGVALRSAQMRKAELSRRSGISRVTIDRLLRDSGGATLHSAEALLDALGYQFMIVKRDPED